MTLTPTPRTVKNRSPKVKARKSALRRAGRTYSDLARLANVTYSMAWKWMNGERVSAECERAFFILTSAPSEKAS